MSAPPDRPDRADPSDIRVVPYSPPRPSDSEDTASARHNWLSTDDGGRSNAASGKPKPSSTTAPPSRGGAVSGWGPATIRHISSSDPSSGPPASATPVPSITAVNAPSRGRLSAASYTTHTSQSSRQSTSSHLSDAEPSSSSVASSTPSSQRRPESRRRNFVAVLNEDKTFSLVPQRARDPDHGPPPSMPQSLPRASSALSDYGGNNFRSSQLHAYPTTPRVSQSSSHEGYSSYASSHYDRPSSSLAGTIPDRSITPSTPVPSSPGSMSSYQETITEDPNAETSASPWNYRMVGGLRKVLDLSGPDAKGKQPSHSPGSDTTETPLPAVPETDAPSQDEDQVDNTASAQQEQASIHSATPSGGSDTTNYRVYGDDSEAPSPPQPRTNEQDDQGEGQGSDDSLVDPHLRPQPSFATAQTASTEFESTNYKVYGASDDEGSEEALADSPVAGPSSQALRPPHLQPQISIGSIESGASSVSDNPNYRVYGPDSPALSPVAESEPIREAEQRQEPHELRPEPSFLSAASTTYETDNYKIYGGRISPAALSSVESFNPPSPCGSYAPLLRSPSGPLPSLYAQQEEEEAGPSGTANTDTNNEPNYVVHGEPTPGPSREVTPETSESGGTVVRHPREEYSQESLVVSPLRPGRPFEEGFGYFRARSRSRSKGELNAQKSRKSLKSVKSSISSAINEEAADNFFAGQAYLDDQAGYYEASSPSVAGPSERQRQLDEQRERERERQLREAAAWEGAGAAPGSQGTPMALPTTPHQWSSQLSTVMSESEPDSSSGTHGSLASGSLHGSHGSHERRSSRGWSSHSRQMLSISSSLAADLEAASRSRSNSQPGSIERPGPAYRGYHGTVRDHDEDGDGLAELHGISPRPSRSRLSDMFTNSNSSERNLHSSASTRSFNNNIPLWAKLYYGSGERRYLRSASISSMSDLSSRPDSVMRQSGSPASDNFPQGVYSPRRRAKDAVAHRRSTLGSMEIQPVQAEDDQELSFRRSIRRMTSSLWSPHLRRDVRAQNRYSIWDTPSVAWSAESGMLGRRNIQVVLFVVGFVVPFAWMVGALLPLPKPSPLSMIQRDSSYSDLGVRTQSHEYERHIESVDELRHQNARWWRMLNRCMSVIGLLVLGAVAGLVVATVKEGWGTMT